MTENIRTQEESLNRFNKEFVETLNELKSKKKKLEKKINKEKSELSVLQKQISEFDTTKKTLETSIHKKEKNLNTVNSTITSTQAAYIKIIEVSHVLLTVIKKDKRNMKE
tara:strand:- start:188 stop:517 length:330 start_codon:yes stop_codon:yes gene_type:complete